MKFIDVKSGNTEQELTTRGDKNKGSERTFCIWSRGHRDNVHLVTKKRITRFTPHFDRIHGSKSAEVAMYHCYELPFPINWPAMDYTNVDHDHRAYQWHWGGATDDISTAYFDRVKPKSAKREK